MKKKDRLSYEEKIASGKIAKFTANTKALILIRDKSCIICKIDWQLSIWTEYHHIYYWTHKAELNNPTRNNSDKWILLCHDCHHEIHHWVKGLWQEYREYCIEYCNNIQLT